MKISYFKFLVLGLLFINIQSVFADYSIDRSSTTSGGGTYGSILLMNARISGNSLYTTVKKQNGGNFSTSGKMTLQVGAYQDYGVDRLVKRINAGASSISLNHDLSSYTGYPKYFYVRYDADNGIDAWVGPIKVTYTESVPGTPSRPSASATSPTRVSVTWSAINNATKYALFRSTSSSGSYSQIYCSSNRAYADSGDHLSANTNYYYKLKAGNSSASCFNNGTGTGWSSFSSYKQVRTDNYAIPSVSSLSSNQSINLGSSYSLRGTVYAGSGDRLRKVSAAVTGPGISGSNSTAMTSGNINVSSYSLSSFRFRTSTFNQAGSYTVGIWANTNAYSSRLLGSFKITVVDTSPKVTSVSPTTATLNQLTTFTAYGQNLSSSLALYIPDCSGMTSVSGSSTSRTFRCTPSYTGGNKSSLVKASSGGTTLYSFNVNIVDTSPKVTAVSPTNVTLNEKTTFTVTGTNLPSTLQVYIPECDQLSVLGGNATSRQFSCTPSFTAGIKASVVKEKAGGAVLNNFNVTVVDTSPKVTTLTPTNVTLGQQTIFTVAGSYLPSSLALFVPECEGMTALGGSATSRQFGCTPSHTGGVKSAEVKNKAGGTLLRSFSVTVVDTRVKIDSVTPNSVKLNEATTFTVTGANLPNTLVLFIPECEGMSALGGSQISRQFSCTPSHTSGIKTALVKDKAGVEGTTLYSFDVNVVDLAPVVTGVTPLEATLDQLTTFTVTGTNLTDSTVFFIEECKDPILLIGGSQTQRQFTCTPSFTAGTKNGVVKDKENGNELFTFNINVSNEDIYLNVSNWAQPAADYLVNADIITDPADHDLRGTSVANRAELATIMYRALGSGKSNADDKFATWAGGVLPSVFFDVNDASAWYYKPVVYLSHLDFSDAVTVFDQGSGDSFNPTFRPANPISRAWALKVILESWDIKPLTSFTNATVFDDVPFNHPAAGYIYQAKQSGLISGDGGNNNYRPNQAVSREELFVILHRLMEKQANLKDAQIAEPSVSSASFVQGNGATSAIGHRYEQPICYGVTPPQVSIQQSAGSTQQIDGANVYSIEFTANVSGGSDSCVDSSQVTHQKNLFAAWRANGGAFIDITPSGSEVAYQKVRWVAPDQYAPASGNAAYEVTLFVGDNLGTEVSDVATVTLDERTTATEEPTVTLDTVSTPITGGSAIQLSGTATDGGSTSRANYGIREVIVEMSFDGTNWERIAQNIGVDEQNQWEAEWIAPDVNQAITLRVQARNNAGNLNASEVTQVVIIAPVLRIDGYVIDLNGNPITNAQVVLTGSEIQKTLSDNNGAFDFSDIQSGSYVVKAIEGVVESDEQAIDVNVESPKLSVSLVIVPDSDQDGIKDDQDNCIAISNTDQANQDNDSLGDVCDDDRDGDGVNNVEDAFPDDPSKWDALPVVTSVSPLQANMDEQTTFIVQGENLPETLDFDLDGCTGIVKSEGSTNSTVQFVCIPTVAGLRAGLINRQNESETIFTFQIDVKELCPQVITPAYDPNTGEEKDYATPCDVPEGWVKGEAPDNDNDGQNDIVDLDDDNDGMPDIWETANGLNPKDASDANGDADNDGVTNKDEFEGNSDPNDSTSLPVTEFQIVSISSCSRVTSGSEVRCDIGYTTSDNNANLSGIGFRLHFDASKLEWLGFEEIIQDGVFNLDTPPSNDVADDDNDASTTEYVNTAWTNLQNQWPSQVPVKLFTARFKAKDTLAVGDTTVIRFSSTGTANGYAFESQPHTMTVVNGCTFDIDGDGQSKPLTDGLLTLRYMFSFRGEALINGAVGSGATRQSATDIEQDLESCVNDFDVDADGASKPLTDGLLILRYLFSFRDDALINGAVGSGATRSDATSIAEYMDQRM